MLLPIAAIILGLALLIWSADRFVFGAAALARNLGIAPMIIGLTIVAMGSSAPEIVVSTMASLAGKPDTAVGNALGNLDLHGPIANAELARRPSKGLVKRQGDRS